MAMIGKVLRMHHRASLSSVCTFVAAIAPARCARAGVGLIPCGACARAVLQRLPC